MPTSQLPSSTAPAAPVLATRGLACRRGRRLLFRGLDMQLPRGSITWLRGRNGSGKTSLLRILAGLSTPAEGEVTLDGRALSTRRAADDQRHLLYVGHANALKEDLTLAESLAFLARLQGLDGAEPRAEVALGRLGLASRRHAAVRTLSQGQRRRGALARLALDDSPRTWILDEPFDALDRESTTVLAGLIEDQAARGGAVLLTSHQDLPLAAFDTLDLERWQAEAGRGRG